MNSLNSKIALGLSGGVDSAVSAYLLKQQGYNVTAVYLECWRMPGCRAEQDRQDALKIALQLDLPFQVLDFRKTYQDKVMGYFLQEYRAGHTPNPDVLCNQVIKFGLFYDWALEQGFDAISTGHYAQTGELQTPITSNSDQSNPTKNNPNQPNHTIPVLLTSRDLHKDQTYFLHQIKQEQIPHIIFPAGHLLKDEVREIASQANLHVAHKKDSVGICFVGDINVHNFLKENLGEKPGDIVTADNKKIGEHQGIWFYTIGQRHGFKLNMKLVKQHTNWLNKDGNIPPLYVIKRDPAKNQLVVGLKPETQTNTFEVASLHKINPNSDWSKLSLQVRIRHTGKLVDCQLNKTGDKFIVTTQESLQGIAEGQFAVFYTPMAKQQQKSKGKYLCLGGGVIC